MSERRTEQIAAKESADFKIDLTIILQGDRRDEILHWADVVALLCLHGWPEVVVAGRWRNDESWKTRLRCGKCGASGEVGTGGMANAFKHETSGTWMGGGANCRRRVDRRVVFGALGAAASSPMPVSVSKDRVSFSAPTPTGQSRASTGFASLATGDDMVALA